MILFGLINQFRMGANGFAHQMIPGAARTSWMKSFLIFFAAGLWCLPLRGDTLTNAIEFQNSIPRPGSIQWDINHRLYKEHQELYRKRMAIPNAVRTNVPGRRRCLFGLQSENRGGFHTTSDRLVWDVS
jgi:hypothetical protein